jgi:O-antigen ligase
MAHTDARTQWLDHGATIWSIGLPIALLLLPFPYSMFAGLVGFFGLCVWQTYFYAGAVFSRLHRSGFIAISILLVISASFAHFPGEAYLQLTHFLPFFWFWAALTLYLQKAPKPWSQIYHWALILVLTAVPINVIGLSEYALKLRYSSATLTRFPLIDWLYIGDLNVLRSYSLFDYPNTLASYLIMILGLNLGLLWVNPQAAAFGARWPVGLRLGLAVNIWLTLLCLFCSGSRNGYLVAALLLVISFLAIRAHRWAKVLGLGSLALIIATTLRFGMAGRTVSWDWFTQDPRVHVWRLALEMIRDRPLLGQGLGNYKLLYNGEVPQYDYIAHAHNLWLMLASEAGLPVMILFTLAVGMIWYRGLQALLSLQTKPHHFSLLMGYHLSFLGITLFSLLDITLTEARVNFVAWLSLGVIYAGTELSQRLNRPN